MSRTCQDCGCLLTEKERHYYGHTCNECEGRRMALVDGEAPPARSQCGQDTFEVFATAFGANLERNGKTGGYQYQQTADLWRAWQKAHGA